MNASFQNRYKSNFFFEKNSYSFIVDNEFKNFNPEGGNSYSSANQFFFDLTLGNWVINQISYYDVGKLYSDLRKSFFELG